MSNSNIVRCGLCGTPLDDSAICNHKPCEEFSAKPSSISIDGHAGAIPLGPPDPYDRGYKDGFAAAKRGRTVAPE